MFVSQLVLCLNPGLIIIMYLRKEVRIPSEIRQEKFTIIFLLKILFLKGTEILRRH